MRKLELKRVYRHFKGDYYLVEDIARNSKTEEEYPDVKQKYRFERQNIESVREEK